MIHVLYYLFNSFGFSGKPLLFIEENPDEIKLPKWVKVSKKRFNEILSTITKAKNERLKTTVDGKEITLDNAKSLLKDIASGKVDESEFKKTYNSIVDDVGVILQKPMITRSQKS